MDHHDALGPCFSGGSLSNHPRIVRLRQQVADLPVDQEYRSRLNHSIDLYGEQIVTRPVYAPGEGWDDLEALQQVTLSDWMEMSLRRQYEDLLVRADDKSSCGMLEEQDHHVVQVTKDKTMRRSEFLKTMERLDQPGYQLPVEMDEEVRAVIVRTWKQLKERGLNSSSLVNRQRLRDLAAGHVISPEFLIQKVTAAVNVGMQAAVDGVEAAIHLKSSDPKSTDER